MLIDQGREFLGKFQALLELTYIDHRTTSRDHPKVDGLIERMVQIVKRALRKFDLQQGHNDDWNLQLPWLAMGYRFNKQTSLATFSLYFSLYGRDPGLPASLQRDNQAVVNLDDPKIWIEVCTMRARLFERIMPMAFDNLAIAQHCDTFRYATIRGGGYQPQLRKFCIRKLSLLATNRSNDVGCNCRSSHFEGQESTFKRCIGVKGP